MTRLSPEEIARIQALTPGERVAESTRLYWAARRERETAERLAHPDWTEEQVCDHVRRALLQRPDDPLHEHARTTYLADE